MNDLAEMLASAKVQGYKEGIDDFVKCCIKKQEALFVNPSVTEQMQFKAFLYVVAEQLKEKNNE